MRNNSLVSKLIPIMIAFFAMGFVDLVGIATNYIKIDFSLSDSLANLFPSMVFIWFLIFSIPTGVLMNRIGRRNTVVISLTLTTLALIIPLLNYSFVSMLISFTLIGIGNALMQVSLNPLLAGIVSGEKLPSTLTFGQFIKAIASFIAPVIALWAATSLGDWKMLFVVFTLISAIAGVYLFLIKIPEQRSEGKTSTFKECFQLFDDKLVTFLFIGILVHVGIDVGVNTTAPKLLMERAGLPLGEAGYITSLYFICRTIGCFAGALILANFSSYKFFYISVITMLIAILGLFFSFNTILIYICIGLIGFGNSNIFPIIFSRALQHLPERRNEISGLMITGIFGGALFVAAMGIASDLLGGQVGAVVILTMCVSYLIFLTTRMKVA
jgi:fucose permease